MANNRAYGINCDGCCAGFDGDPTDLIGANDALASRVSFDPEKFREITWFWLCGDCAPEYPRGAEDFYVSEYWDNIPKCDSCGIEDVESAGHFCDYCIESALVE
jgi:hypothetical protein